MLNRSLVLFLAASALSLPALATTFVSVQGTDAIYLAGRTDIVIPALDGSFALGRHNFGVVPADFLLETFPASFAATGGNVFTFSATGCVGYFNGVNCPAGYGPDGNPAASSITSLGGISSYNGFQGALVGLFLDGAIPNGAAPAGINFVALGADFPTLSPALGQVFFIGDGLTAGNVVQQFTAPGGTTRLFLGIADGFGFAGAPGAYEDNDGSFRVGIDAVPEPSTYLMVCSALALFALGRRRR